MVGLIEKLMERLDGKTEMSRKDIVREIKYIRFNKADSLKLISDLEAQGRVMRMSRDKFRILG